MGQSKKFDMEEGMTMVFRVSDPALLKACEGRRQSEVRCGKINGQFTVTDIKKAK